MIDSSDVPLSTVREQLRAAEQMIARADRGLAEIGEKLSQLESEAADRERLFDALGRFGYLWEVLAQREKAKFMRQLIKSVTFDPLTRNVSLTFKRRP
jgi:hypothetical protein